MVGILYCQKSSLDYKEIEKLLTAHNIPSRSIILEEADEHSFTDCTVLINAMGNLYVEEKNELLVNFFNTGNSIIHLGSMPFTRSATDTQANNRVLRSFGIVDDFTPIKETCSYVKVQDNVSRSAAPMSDSTASTQSDTAGDTVQVSLTGLCSAVYHLSAYTENGTRRTGYLEHILDAFDGEDNLVAVPVIRVVTYEKGSMTFFAFDFDTEMLKEVFWAELFINVVKKELAGNVLLTVDSVFARYYPEEEKRVSVKLANINRISSADLSLSITVSDNSGCTVFEQKEMVALPYETTITPQVTASSVYKIVVTVSSGDVILTQKETGFMVLSKDEASAELADFKPMYIDPAVSADYCLVDGEITAILGTTHFVTDVYRECFYYMNTWLCNKELAQLQADGFNVLRSGNWVYIPAFYNEDGSIGERGIRALQTYFILAARYGFTVQFALGTVLLNQWDKSRSPIHDKGMREKCMTLIRSFVENFKDYPNVTLDIVNEPSYSIKGAWSIGKPSEEPGELARFKEWLSEKYGTIENLRATWGETSMVLKSFDDVTMPGGDLFSRGLCRTEQRKNHTPLADFFAFARNEFLGWTGEIRAIAREIAPNMIVTMGRDETLRIPAQQDEVLAGNIDMVCWHQWNYNSNIIYEYLLNRVRGKICVAQELGMYRFDDIRSGKRHTDEETAASLDKKLLYAAGNFVQWQAHDDPFMFELSENSLGIYRADMTPTPSVALTKKLVNAERSMQHLMCGRQDDKIKILSVYNTSYYFGVDNGMAHQGMKNHIYALYNCLKEQADFVPEHLFKAENASAIGNPKLIILPGMQTLQKDTWKELLAYVEKGAVLLVNGCIDKEVHFEKDIKIGALDSSYRTRKLMNFEKITVDSAEYALDFRPVTGHADVTNLLDCGELSAYGVIAEYNVGAGKILYCPYPVELSTNTEAMVACYKYAIEKAKAQNEIYQTIESRPQIVFTAVSYENCTVYTLINEGFADTMTFVDLRSGKKVSVNLKDNQGCKLWIDNKGELLQKYGDAEVDVC
ncbi:MAG: beta-galactosidase [Lachnospiraceae bacterium]|nr:beta-galactosidase [Lachnospiraceae bacterium]